jgi:uncharacterized protein
MDLLWNVISALMILAGIIGSFAPILPGPPLAYFGLLILQLKSIPPFSTRFLVIWAVVVIIVTLLDYLVPVYGTKRFGGTRYGMVGCTLGLFAGFWLGPVGIIVGPFIGAFVGEILASNNSNLALKAAIGSFIGFLFSSLLKLIACFMMGYYFLVSL